VQSSFEFKPVKIGNVTDFDRRVLAITLYAEARGESHQGRWWVAWTIRNRVERRRWWGKVNLWDEYEYFVKDKIEPHSFAAVCLFKWQFSCWNPADDTNHIISYALLTEDNIYTECLYKKGRHRFEYDGATYWVDCDILNECLKIAHRIDLKAEQDPVDGATHYFAHNEVTPDWSKSENMIYIDKYKNHTFMKEV